MLDTIICSIICLTVTIKEPKYERQEPPKVEQTTRQETPIHKSNARQIKRQGVPTRYVSKNLSKFQANNDGGVQSIIAQHFGEETPEVLEIVRRESTFNPKAINKSSGACGLFQSLPCKKMNCSLDDVECQVKWGRSYIKSRYGSAENALAFHDRMGWY